MREEYLFAEAVRLGGYGFIAVIVMFFLILGFRKESITRPRAFHWAVVCLGISLAIPLAASMLSLSRLAVPQGFDSVGVLLAVMMAASPFFFLGSVLLSLFALLPAPALAVPRASQPPRPHPLD